MTSPKRARGRESLGRRKGPDEERSETYDGREEPDVEGSGRRQVHPGGCPEKNLPEATCHRWRARFGLMEVNEAKRLKELERENGELKQMLAESLLKNRVLEAVCEKKL